MAKRDERNLVERFNKRVADSYENTKDRIVDTKDKAGDLISDHPFASVAIAAGIGVLIGIGMSEVIRRSR